MGFWKPFQAPNPSAGEPSTPQATPHGAWRCSSVREKGEILQVIEFIDNFKNDRMNFGPELDTSVCEKREATSSSQSYPQKQDRSAGGRLTRLRPCLGFTDNQARSCPPHLKVTFAVHHTSRRLAHLAFDSVLNCGPGLDLGTRRSVAIDQGHSAQHPAAKPRCHATWRALARHGSNT